MNAVKLDLTKAHPAYYKAKQKPVIEEFGTYNYLTIEGQSAPEDKLFLSSIETIYPVAYAIKFICKDREEDFVVPKMEGQWWVNDSRPFDEVPRHEWYWRILIRMPEFVDKTTFEVAMENLKTKGKPILLEDVKFEGIKEGKCVQMLHIGSYEEEQETIQQIFQKIKEENLEINGYHHEIYISNPMKTPAWKLKTIIRYPVK